MHVGIEPKHNHSLEHVDFMIDNLSLEYVVESLSFDVPTHVKALDNFAIDCNKLSCDDALHVNNLDLESLDNNVESLDDLLDECIDEYIVDTFGHSSPTCVHEYSVHFTAFF